MNTRYDINKFKDKSKDNFKKNLKDKILKVKKLIRI